MSLEELATKQPDDDNDEDEVILKPKKPKRVCSEKQLDALKLNRAKAAALRTEEADTKKLKKGIDLVENSKSSQLSVSKKNNLIGSPSANLELNPSGSVETAKSKIPDPKINDLKKPSKDTHKPIDKPDSDNSSSEEEEVVVVKKSKKVVEKPKKKKKIITIEISDTESEEEDEPVVQKPLPSSLPSRKMITLQNKKSLIKVHKPEPVFNMFCD